MYKRVYMCVRAVFGNGARGDGEVAGGDFSCWVGDGNSNGGEYLLVEIVWGLGFVSGLTSSGVILWVGMKV